MEDDITNEEAEKLIEEPLPSPDDLVVSDQFTITSNEADLFTARLMRYEVLTLRMYDRMKHSFYKNKKTCLTCLP